MSDRVSVCVPFVLYDVIKKQFPDYDIFREDYIRQANLAGYDKIVDLKNYPSFQKDINNPHQMTFPSYRRLKQHAIKHYLDAVATLHPGIDNSYSGYPYFKQAIQSQRAYFTVHPGAGFAAKYWPAEKYGQLINMLLDIFEDMDCKLILGPEDPKAEDIFRTVPGRVTIPKGNLEMIADEISGSLFHIGNDSGITHLAGAFNIPVVAIHGPTGPGTWMSFTEQTEVIWGKQGVCDVSCNYDIAISCEHRICLNSVTPQRVLRHALKLLQRVLPVGQQFRLVLNPEACMQEKDQSVILKAGGKELLIEFAQPMEMEVFKGLVKNNGLQTEPSESLNKVIDVLIQNGLLFKIPLWESDISKTKILNQVDVTIVSHVMKSDSIGRQGIVMAEILDGAFTINGLATRKPTPEGIEPALYQKLTHRGAPGKLALFTDVLWHNKSFRPYARIPRQSAIKVCYSMFESSAILEEWVDIINDNFDGVLVPDKWLVDIYKNSGVKKPLEVLPLACDLKYFLGHPVKQHCNDVFTFGVSATALVRKNIPGVISAFQLAFPDLNDKVKLKIHSRNGSAQEVEKITQIAGHDRRIEFLVNTVSEKDYLDFMTSLDAYVLLTMGEGFSVTPREAMALGLPVILSNNTAQGTICESGLVLPVNTISEVPAFYEIFNRSIGNFFVPDIVQAAGFMKQMYNNRHTLYNDAAKRKQWAAQYDLVNMKPMYLNTIREILNGNFC